MAQGQVEMMILRVCVRPERILFVWHSNSTIDVRMLRPTQRSHMVLVLLDFLSRITQARFQSCFPVYLCEVRTCHPVPTVGTLWCLDLNGPAEHILCLSSSLGLCLIANPDQYLSFKGIFNPILLSSFFLLFLQQNNYSLNSSHTCVPLGHLTFESSLVFFHLDSHKPFC